MDTLFLKLLDMSLSAGWVVLGVLLLRLLLRKAPKWVSCALWALVAVRLVCPFSFESTVSLMPDVEFPSQKLQTAAAEPGEILSIPSYPATALETPEQPSAAPEREDSAVIVMATEGTEEAAPWLEIGSILWAAGMVGMLLYAAVSYLRLRKKVGASIELGNGVYLCDYIDSPFILGMGKPRIYLSSAMDPRDAAHVLAHERSHLKRKDHWWKPLGFVLLSVYWFHPLLWVAYVLLCRDIELACDERVVKDMNLGDKKAYSEALLKCSVPRHMIVACPLAFGEVGVKQRIKSVLRYKKPAFWVVVIAVVVCLIAGVCLLTDPAANTLANFLDIRENNLTEIEIQTLDGVLYLDSPGDYAPILEVLGESEYGTVPLSQEPIQGKVDEYGWYYPYIALSCGEEQTFLYFSFDYTQVWKADAEGTSLPYAVIDPAALQDYMETHVRTVYQQSTSAAPFATQAEPLKWAANLHSDAILEARLFVAEEDLTLSATRISYALLEELLPRLNALSEDAFRAERTDDAFDYDDLRYFSGSPVDTVGASLLIADGGNDLTGILRLYDGKLELVLLDGAQWLDDHWRMKNTSARIWSIEDEPLRAFLDSLIQDHPSVMMYLGMKYDFARALLNVCHGNAHFSAPVMSDWDYEIVEYTEGAKSFGIRCRPKAVDEGWLYFSFWPEGYDPAEEDRYYFEGLSDGYRYVSSYPSAVKQANGIDTTNHSFSYIKTEFPTGDFAVILEDADDWSLEYKDVISDQQAFISFQYGSAGEDPLLRTYGDVTVDFSRLPEGDAYYNYGLFYFDWDAILAETGATELTLLTQKLAGDELFLVGQYEERFCFLCFEKTDMGYQFRTLLSGGEVQSEITEEGTQIRYADYRYADEQKRLLLVLDEDVTAIQCTGGYRDYQRLDSFPALLILDKALWGEAGEYSYTFRYDEPPAVCYDSNLNLGPLFFREPEAEEERLYLYSGLVTFYDGVHMPGGYSLSSEELQTLKEILLSLPRDAIEKCGEPEPAELYADITLAADNGHGDTEKETVFDFSYNGSLVTITLRTARNGDWVNNVTKAYFQVDDPGLNSFMESLRDDSRKNFNVASVHPEETVSYSHGEGSIVLDNQLGWEFEIVEYTDDETPFGIRCRPVGYDQGWVFFSYWPDGFTRPEDAEIHKDIHFQAGSYIFETGYYAEGDGDSGKPWRYQKVRNVPGDYVILNEGAESWLDLEGIHFAALIRTDSFAGGTIIEEKPFVYPQCDDPSAGPGNCVFGTNDNNKGYLEIDPGWMFSIWDNDEIPYSHLFRFWPEWETEGFISFSFIEGGFTPEDGLIVEEISLSEPIRPFPGYTATAEGAEHWQYLWIDVEGGSYLFRNDGADHWTDKQWQEVMEMINSIVIAQYDLPQ